jgi:hypothetical protein
LPRHIGTSEITYATCLAVPRRARASKKKKKNLRARLRRQRLYPRASGFFIGNVQGICNDRGFSGRTASNGRPNGTSGRRFEILIERVGVNERVSFVLFLGTPHPPLIFPRGAPVAYHSYYFTVYPFIFSYGAFLRGLGLSVFPVQFQDDR